MINPDLTPTVITDVNGRVTTVHKRAQQQKNARSPLPTVPPALSDLTPLKKNPSRPYKPTASQQAHRMMHLVIWERNASSELLAALGSSEPNRGARIAGLYVSDVEAYSVFSMTSEENAILLMEKGIRSREDAFRFFEDHNLMHLEKDYSELTDIALRRKLNFSDFALFVKQSFSDGVDLKLFAEAAEANNTKGLRDVKAFPGRKLTDLIISGEIALADIKSMTASRIGSPLTGPATFNELIAINKGERDYDAKQLRRALEETSGALTDDETIELIRSIGLSSTRSIRDKKLGYAVHWNVKDRDEYKYNTFKRMEVVQYANILSIFRRKESAEDVITMYESGADAGEVAKALNSGMTIPQAIAVHAEGAPKSISGGWL